MIEEYIGSLIGHLVPVVLLFLLVVFGFGLAGKGFSGKFPVTKKKTISGPLSYVLGTICLIFGLFGFLFLLSCAYNFLSS